MFSSMQFLRSGLASASPRAQQRLVTNLSSTRFRRLDLNPARFFSSSSSTLPGEGKRPHPSFAQSPLFASSTTANTLAKRALPFEDTASPFSSNGSPRFKQNRSASQSYFYIFFGLLLAVAVGSEEKKANELQAQEQGFSTDDPLGSQYFSSLEAGTLEQEHLSRIKTSYKERLAVLNISDFSLGELEALDQWLATHYHCFMRLEGAAAAEAEAVIQSIEGKLKDNEALYRDRASPAECARFACLAYENDLSKITEQLSEDWEVLREADGEPLKAVCKESAYSGIAFVNHQTRNVVIAHRGTVFPNSDWTTTIEFLKCLRADFEEVAQLRIGPQQKAAHDLVEKVYMRVHQHGYTIGCAGHSLGGWIAQLTAFHLQQEHTQENVYVVCLDSPGAKEMIDRHYRWKYKKNEKNEILELDVSNYVFLPNLVNTCGIHVGALYQICPENFKVEKTPWYALGQLHTHGKELIADTILKPDNLLEVENWPLRSWDELLGWADKNKAELVQSLMRPVDSLMEVGVQAYDVEGKLEELQRASQRCAKELAFKGSVSSFELRYQASYRATLLEPNTLGLGHFSKSTRDLLRQIDEMHRLLSGNPDASAVWECFLKEQARQEKIPEEHLEILKSFALHEQTVKTKNSSLDFRNELERFFLCYPELSKKLTMANYREFYRQDYQYLKPAEFFEKGCLNCPTIPRGFITRKEQHDKFDEKFKKPGTIHLFGPPGSGKTTLASSYGKKFAEDRKGKKSLTFFIDASSTRSLRRDWRTLASKLGVTSFSQTENLVQEVYRRLKSFDDYLLIFDQVALPKEEVEHYLQAGKGKILFVSDANTHLESLAQTELDMVERYTLSENQLDQLLLNGATSSTFLERLSPKLKTALKKSPLKAAILARYLAQSTIANEKQGLISALNETGDDNILNTFMKIIVEQTCKELGCVSEECQQEKGAIARALSPLLCETSPSEEVIEDWWASEQQAAGNHLSAGQSNVKRAVAQILNQNSQIPTELCAQGQDNTNAPLSQISPLTYSANPEAARALREVLGWKEDQHPQAFLQFLSEKINMNNIKTKDFKDNKKLRIISDHLVKFFKKNNDPTEENRRLIAKVLNAIANNQLQEGLLQESQDSFEEVKIICEQKAGFPSGAEGQEGDVVQKLEQANPELALQYTLSLHYLGKIYFQKRRFPEAEKFFGLAIDSLQLLKEGVSINSALFVKEEHSTNVLLLNDIQLNARIYQRQGPGWMLVESQWGKNSMKYAASLQRLGRVYFQKEKISVAEAPFHLTLKSLQLLKKNSGANSSLFLKEEQSQKAPVLEKIRRNARIYQKQGPVWEDREENDLLKAERLYLRIYNEDKYAFNLHYCNLQLAKTYFKLAKKGKNRIYYYQNAMKRLQDGGTHGNVPFLGALGVATGGSKDFCQLYLLKGEILADRDNPYYSFHEAEENFQRVINLAATSEPNIIKADHLFCAYLGLVQLYTSQADWVGRDAPEKKRKNILKAIRSARQALRTLVDHPEISDKRGSEINELEELLSRGISAER